MNILCCDRWRRSNRLKHLLLNLRFYEINSSRRCLAWLTIISQQTYESGLSGFNAVVVLAEYLGQDYP